MQQLFNHWLDNPEPFLPPKGTGITKMRGITRLTADSHDDGADYIGLTLNVPYNNEYGTGTGFV